MTRHEMRECIFCLMFQNDFYGTDEFEEQMSNFLANFHFPESVPVGVAVNEAVELAKEYGGENGAAFVNGILGKIVNE